jgi:WD40-like Beta Propeller Repeat
VVIDRGELRSQQIWILPTFGDRKAFPLFPKVTYDHFEGRVSPDGKWIAYVSAETGRSEVYVTSFPLGIGKWQISSGGTPRCSVAARGKGTLFRQRRWQISRETFAVSRSLDGRPISARVSLIFCCGSRVKNGDC